MKKKLTPIEQSWALVAEHRLEELRSGKVREVPSEEVSARIRSILNAAAASQKRRVNPKKS